MQALATNKLAGFAGTTTSAVTYARRVRVDLRTALPMAAAAGLAAAGGAALAHLVPAGALRPVVLVALVAVAAWTLLRSPPSETAALRFAGRRHVVAAAALGAARRAATTARWARAPAASSSPVWWGSGTPSWPRARWPRW